jgi:hypothetical protein
VREKYLLRRIISTCTEYAARAYDEQNEVPVLLNEVEKNVLLIGQDRFSGSTKTIKSLAIGALESVENLYKNRGTLTGLATGFKELDEMTNGLQRGEMIVIAARPSMGKTALAMNIVEHVAVNDGKCVAVFSLEMSGPQLAMRFLSSAGRLDQTKIRTGKLSDEDWEKMTVALGKLHDARGPRIDEQRHLHDVLDDSPSRPDSAEAFGQSLQGGFVSGLVQDDHAARFLLGGGVHPAQLVIEAVAQLLERDLHRIVIGKRLLVYGTRERTSAVTVVPQDSKHVLDSLLASVAAHQSASTLAY